MEERRNGEEEGWRRMMRKNKIKIKVALRMIFQLRLKFHVVACYGKGSFWLRTLFFFFAFIPSTFAPSL